MPARETDEEADVAMENADVANGEGTWDDESISDSQSQPGDAESRR